MNDRAGFISHLTEHPDDVTPRLAFADWLEEDDRDRHEDAAALREDLKPEDVLNLLPWLADVNAPRVELERVRALYRVTRFENIRPDAPNGMTGVTVADGWVAPIMSTFVVWNFPQMRQLAVFGVLVQDVNSPCEIALAVDRAMLFRCPVDAGTHKIEFPAPLVMYGGAELWMRSEKTKAAKVTVNWTLRG
jgi:uncharacterized protein (TIGR02996 family)